MKEISSGKKDYSKEDIDKAMMEQEKFKKEQEEIDKKEDEQIKKKDDEKRANYQNFQNIVKSYREKNDNSEEEEKKQDQTQKSEYPSKTLINSMQGHQLEDKIRSDLYDMEENKANSDDLRDWKEELPKQEKTNFKISSGVDGKGVKVFDKEKTHLYPHTNPVRSVDDLLAEKGVSETNQNEDLQETLPPGGAIIDPDDN
jgi:hypothetical protein